MPQFPSLKKVNLWHLTLPRKSWVHLGKETGGWALGNIVGFFFQWRIQYWHISLQWPTWARQQQAEDDKEGDVIRRSDPQICNATITIHNNGYITGPRSRIQEYMLHNELWEIFYSPGVLLQSAFGVLSDQRPVLTWFVRCLGLHGTVGHA